ncbi:ferrous iron transporter B [Peptococcaceae bacterium]|nr:ferrous iron transporter B [Peptococcaceae bacterium]
MLVGSPNTGKSALFNQLTGLNARVANYPGTTVDISAGSATINGKNLLVVDLPGIYSLESGSKAEKVAISMLKNEFANNSDELSKRLKIDSDKINSLKKVIIFVLDANNLEHNLHLLLKTMQYGLPMLVALNRIDLAEEKGYYIDPLLLSHELGITVVPIVAITGKNIDVLKKELFKIFETSDKQDKAESKKNIEKLDLWKKVDSIAEKAIRYSPFRATTSRQKWGDILVKPWPGLLFAFLIICASFAVVVGLGMSLRQLVFLPIIREGIIPGLTLIVNATVPEGILQRILIGEYGVLVKGLEWPFALVFPYVLSFYIVLSFLEDSGYLPRLSCLITGVFQKMGLNGSAVIPLILGYGCAVPAIISTRALSSHKERLIVITMICLAVPCIAQTGALIALLAEASIKTMLLVFLISLLAIITAAVILDKLLKDRLPPVIMEVPDLLLPKANILLKKVLILVKSFMLTGVFPLFMAIAVASVLYETGVLKLVGNILSPIVTGWLMLPKEAATPLILGILRRELAILPLLEMDLNFLQIFVGAIVGLLYVPCVASVAVIAREFNVFTAIYVLLLTTGTAFFIGGLLYRIGILLI